MNVTVRYFAGARHAAGTEEERHTLTEPVPLAQLVRLVAGTGRPKLAAVLSRCSFLFNEVAVADSGQLVTGGDVVDVLSPFAGG